MTAVPQPVYTDDPQLHQQWLSEAHRWAHGSFEYEPGYVIEAALREQSARVTALLAELEKAQSDRVGRDVPATRRECLRRPSPHCPDSPPTSAP